MNVDANEPKLVVTVSHGVPDDQREAIEASVASMARRAAQASRRAVDSSRDRNLLTQRMNAPLRELIHNNADAAAALATEQEETTSDHSDLLTRRPEWPAVTFVTADPTRLPGGPTTHQVYGSPWHYQWQWHTGQPPSTSSQDRTTGQISLFSFADQDNNWSDAHGGFGVALTSERVQSVVGRSLRRNTYGYLVSGGSLGGNATVEGGMEMTVIENGTVLSYVQDKRFRSRVSSGEEDSVDEPGWETGDSIEVDWVMLPGRVYTFNVGCWVFCEAHGGLGTASFAGGSINGLVIALTGEFTD